MHPTNSAIKHLIDNRTSKKTIYQKLISWLTQEPTLYSPNKMKNFLISRSITQDGVNYYVIVEDVVRKFGIISIYDNQLFLSENDFAQTNFCIWEISFSSIMVFQTQSTENIMKDKFIKLVFNYDKKKVEKFIACPVVVPIYKTPSYETIDNNKTEELYNYLLPKLSLI